MGKIIKKINRELVLYGICGVCVTFLNIGVYYVFSHILKLPVMVATVLAWMVAVVFAYIVNRKYVFRSNITNIHGIVREFFFFVGCRLWSECIDILAMFIFVSYLDFPDMIIKIIANFFVVVFNYLASKFYIFRNVKDIKG